MTSRPFAIALIAALGCGRLDIAAREGASPGPPPTPTPTSTPTSTPAGPASCPWSGPPILVDGTCTGTLSQRVFLRAACACGTLTSGGDLVADGFDSRVARWASGGTGGHVGAVAGLTASGVVDASGDVAVSGGGVNAASTVRVGGDLDVSGSLARASSNVTVGGDARVGGDVSVASLLVAGTFTTSPGAALSGSISAGARAAGAVSVPAACPCGASELVDVAGIIAQHRATNDNASIGLSAGALSSVVADTTVTLPCGRYYLDQIQGGGTVTIRAEGHAALFIGGIVQFSGQLDIELAAGAELDVFIAGALNLPATLRLGDSTRPRALRLWLATSSTFIVPPGAQIAANVYAPAATLAISAPLEIYGAMVAGNLHTVAPFTIHYDRAMAGAAASCGM